MAANTVMISSRAVKPERNCPACQSSSASLEGEKHDFAVLACRSCGTLYTSTLPDTSHSQDYDGYYTAENLSVPEFINQRLDEIVAGFDRYRDSNKLLEVGFGAGSLLQAATRAGWSVSGVEISKTAAEHGRAQGFETFCGELGQANYANGAFDVVIASELLEHVPDPRLVAQEIARIIRPGGLFWATTPNAKGCSPRLLGLDWSVVSPPEHLHLFSEKGLKTLLLDAGFRSVRIGTEGINPFELFDSLRRRNGAKGTEFTTGNERVNSGYRLNEALVKTGPRRAVKNAVNKLLRISHLGDSLKIWAER